MIQTFDYFNLPEDPTFILCQPSGSQLYALGTIYDRKAEYRFNALSTLTFTAPYMIDGELTPYYSSLQYRRIVSIPNIMNFMITGIEETDDGIEKYKEVTCQSLEVTMNYKKLTTFSGTYKFYDIIPVSGSPALLNTVMAYLPGWTIGYVDTALSLLYRTFDISDATIYSFLMNDVETAYQCIFIFDTLSKTINAYSTTTATTDTDIFMSFNNLIEKIKINEVTQEFCTALNVKGGGDLSINQVNPLGSDSIYNFLYYKSTVWMSQGLIDAIDAWEALILANQPTYADLLTQLQSYNATLVTQNSELVDLQSEYKAFEQVYIARVAQGLETSDVKAQMDAKQVEINAQNVAIAQTETLIANITAQLTAINTLVSFDSNFTDDQIVELSEFIIGSTYQNENFIQTDIMELSEIQEQAQELYDQAVFVLAKLSQPRYEFSLDAINFIALEEYSTITAQLELGSVITLDLDGGLTLFEKNYVPTSGSSTLVYPVVLGFDINYDDPTDFSMIFSNRLRLDDSSFQLSDLLGSSSDSAITSSFNSEKWSSWKNNYQDEVSTFITSSLDAAKNSVISGSTQNIVIDQTGIRVRSLISGSTYDDKQVWVNNGVMAFTDDNWNTSKLALGSVVTTGSQKYFGVVSDYLVGRIVAANSLILTNENNTFTLDGAGATLTNATFTLNSTSGNNRIFMDPTNGFKIQKNVGGTWTDKLWLTSAGDINMAGTITATAGNIGTWLITSDGLYSGTSGDYIYSTGYIKLGLLTMTPSSATFAGNIYANNLVGQVTNSQIQSVSFDKITAVSINAGTITAGTMSADRIYGGTIGFGGGSLSMNSYGQALLTVSSAFTVNAGGRSSALYANSAGALTTGTFNCYSLYLNGGSIKPSPATTGVTVGYSVQTPYGTRVLYFTNGVLTSYT
jgi:hypothetical protein